MDIRDWDPEQLHLLRSESEFKAALYGLTPEWFESARQAILAPPASPYPFQN